MQRTAQALLLAAVVTVADANGAPVALRVRLALGRVAGHAIALLEGPSSAVPAPWWPEAVATSLGPALGGLRVQDVVWALGDARAPGWPPPGQPPWAAALLDALSAAEAGWRSVPVVGA